MELIDFFCQLQYEIKSSISDSLETDSEYPFPEFVFTDHMIQHMISAGMTFDQAARCYYSGKSGNAHLKISGYALSEEADQLDLFIALYSGSEYLETITDTETKTAAEQCFRFFSRSIEGKLSKYLEPSSDAAILATLLQEAYASLDQIRIYVLTDRISRTKNFAPRLFMDKTIKLEVMDIERLYRHTVAGKPRDELVVNFPEVCGSALPCVYVPRGETDYDYALTVFPGEALRFLYEKYGSRLLEANVRSFLSVTGKVNKGIRDTLREKPSRFMAYNNGLVIVADEMRLSSDNNGGTGILWLKGMQIVNGGQTTASLYFTKKKYPDTNLSKVFIPAKLIILNTDDSEVEESLISEISRCANSQNVVRQADLTANRSFHRELEQIAGSLFCPDGTGQWFYERTTGSYNVLLAREGTTPARLRKLKERIPTSRKITKTDLAKYINTWERKPSVVALGAQKNFIDFMTMIDLWEEQGFKPDIPWFKQSVAKAIIFKQADRIVATLGTASKIHVTAHLVSTIAEKLGSRIDFDKIWQNQEISSPFKALIAQWAPEVNNIMTKGSNGKLLSEWAKKNECWAQVKSGNYPLPSTTIPEIMNTGLR